MSLAYPDSWSSLEYPWQRAELMAYLEDAGKPDIWRHDHEVKFFIHFFFDDHSFAEDPQSLIGINLLGSEEVAAITIVTNELDKVISSEFAHPITAEIWKPFADAAAEALKLLAQHGVAVPIPD